MLIIMSTSICIKINIYYYITCITLEYIKNFFMLYTTETREFSILKTLTFVRPETGEVETISTVKLSTPLIATRRGSWKL